MRQRSTSRRQNLNGDDWSRINGIGKDPRMAAGGITVLATRRPKKALTTPIELFSDDFVRNLVARRFPLAANFVRDLIAGVEPEKVCSDCRSIFRKTDLLQVIMEGKKNRIRCKQCHQNAQASKWLMVIYRYFRKQESSTEIEEDLGWKGGTVRSVVQKIRRHLAGKRLDGRLRTGRPQGRPARNSL